MSVSKLKELVAHIKTKESYIDHTITNGGYCCVLVLTTKGWFYHNSAGKWKKCTEGLAHDILKANYFEYRFDEMKKKQSVRRRVGLVKK